MELNHCLEVGFSTSAFYSKTHIHNLQEIIRANAHVQIAADLVTKYRKNVQYNLKATREGEAT